MPEEIDTKNKKTENKREPNYWKGFKEIYNDPEFSKKVNEDLTESKPKDANGMSRRKFLAFVGASAALAGAACTDYRDKGEIIPYNKMPEEISLGKPNFYASTCTLCPNTCGILIRTREGRPIKVDGNPEHPVSKGKICVKGQASILDLYDPDRLKGPLRKSKTGIFLKTPWLAANKTFITALDNADKQIAVITHQINSVTTKKLLGEFTKKYPNTKIYSYELFDNTIRNNAWKKSYGTDFYPIIKWDKAKVIVALQSDFLGTEGNRVENARLFAEGRDVDKVKNFNRLYSVEADMSLTGSNADYRLKLKPELQYNFVMSLLNEINRKTNIKIPINVSKFSLKSFAKKYSLDAKKVEFLVNDLIENSGKSIVYAGRSLPEKTHIAVNLLNEILGNTKLYNRKTSNYSVAGLSTYGDFYKLITDMKNGGVSVVIHFDSNPVYHLPDNMGYKKALKKVETVATLTESANESSEVSNFVFATNNQLESWGDAKTRTGFYSLQQPVIAPLYNTRQKEAVILQWVKGLNSKFKENLYHKYLMDNWRATIYPTLNSEIEFKRFWYGILNDGVVLKNEKIKSFGKFKNSSLSGLTTSPVKPNGFTVVIKESYALGDGRQANNGWLQELPNSLAQITWDNYAAISKKTAKKLQVQNNDNIKVDTGSGEKVYPVFIQPGAADNTVTIDSGYGRTKVGRVGEGAGFRISGLMSGKPTFSPWIYTNVKVARAEGTYTVVTDQEHHVFEKKPTENIFKKRGILFEGTVAEYEKDHKFLKNEREEERIVTPAIYPRHPELYKDVKWGMAIDLNKCLACGDCVIACNSENNVPIVGKDQIGRGRRMQWIRIDRYYSVSYDEPIISTQPMLCQQCDDAPCENVCPVAATTHSEDGLNQMIYNRCVGTRYCANNCPYKVRRFNFYNYRDRFKDGFQEEQLFDLIYNPEVTVRSNGVMEKCTFCIQRIMEEKAEAIREKRKIIGENVKVACQVACPTSAIKFGDINAKKSKFVKYRNHELGYYVLEEVNTKPNVTYIAKLRNTHTEES